MGLARGLELIGLLHTQTDLNGRWRKGRLTEELSRNLDNGRWGPRRARLLPAGAEGGRAPCPAWIWSGRLRALITQITEGAGQLMQGA